MKFKKLLYLLIALVLISGLGVYKKIQLDKQEAAEQKEVVKLAVVADGLDASSVKKIVAKKGNNEVDQVVLVKTDAGEWTVENFYKARAKKWQVEQILKNASEIKGELRGDSQDILGDFKIGDDQGLHLDFLGVSDSALLRLVCGAERAPRGGNFVRLADSHQVYLTENNLLGNFNLHNKDAKLEAKSLADLQVLKLDTGKVNRIELSNQGSPTVLVKQEDKEKKSSQWVFEPAGKEELAQDKVSKLLSTLTGLHGSQVLDPSLTHYGFDEKSPWARLAHTADDKPARTELYLGKLDGAQKSYPVKVMPDGLVYEVSQNTIEDIKSDRAGFVKAAEVKK